MHEKTGGVSDKSENKFARTKSTLHSLPAERREKVSSSRRERNEESEEWHGVATMRYGME